MHSINISTAINGKIPDLRLGCIEANVIVGISNNELQLRIDSKLNQLSTELTPEIIREMDTVKATKSAYRVLGKDPNRYRPAAESLMRRIANGKGLYQISNVVDVLNLLSVETGFSICGYDKSAIEGVINLGIGELEEPYQGIGRGDLNIENLPVFRDSKGAFGTPTSDSTRTMISENTKEILFIFMDFESSPALQSTMENCASLLTEFADATNIKTRII